MERKVRCFGRNARTRVCKGNGGARRKGLRLPGGRTVEETEVSVCVIGLSVVDVFCEVIEVDVQVRGV